jgi:hypothetical protein
MRCGLSAQSDGFIEGVWLYRSELTAKTPNRSHQNVNARTENGMAGRTEAPLDASQNAEANFSDKLLCQNLNIIYLSAPISVRPIIRVDAVIQKAWAACNWSSNKSCLDVG